MIKRNSVAGCLLAAKASVACLVAGVVNRFLEGPTHRFVSSLNLSVLCPRFVFVLRGNAFASRLDLSGGRQRYLSSTKGFCELIASTFQEALPPPLDYNGLCTSFCETC